MEFASIIAVLKVLLTLQYFAIWLALFLDATISPLPGETILVFAGYLIYLGQLNMWLVALAAALGSVMGAWLIYELSRAKGEEWLLRYGRYVLLDSDDVAKADKWFKKHGENAVFVGRFIPMVSQLVSIPAGLSKMKRWKFLIYSFTGSFIYNALLAFLFYQVGKRWDIALQYLEPIQLVLGIIVGAFLLLFIVRRVMRKTRYFASWL